MRAYPADGREIGMCIKGQKAWCEKLGWNFKSFVRNGIDVDSARDVDDANVQRLIQHVEEKHRGR